MIFNHTAEMLDFFSDKLDYPYPWDKYAQLIAKDFALEPDGGLLSRAAQIMVQHLAGSLAMVFSKDPLRMNITSICGQTKPLQCFFFIFGYAEPMGITNPQIKLRHHMAFL